MVGAITGSISQVPCAGEGSAVFVETIFAGEVTAAWGSTAVRVGGDCGGVFAAQALKTIMNKVRINIFFIPVE